MKKLYIFFELIFLLIFSDSYSTVGILPQFDISIRNIHTNPTYRPDGQVQDSLCDFDIYCIWTNSASSDPFIYAAGQTTLFWNTGIITGPVTNGVTTFLTKTGSDLPLSNQSSTFTTSPQAGINLLRTSANIPANNGYLVNTTFPGTKIISLRFRTTNMIFQQHPINLRFKVGAAPNSLLSYFDPDGVVVAFTDTTLYTRSLPEYVVFPTPPPPPPNPPISNFYADSIIIKAGRSVNFFDSTINIPSSWSWSFPGGTPSTSNVKNPTGVVYNALGTYSVTLIATNFRGSDSITKLNYITVIPNPKRIKLKVFSEGFYYPLFNQLSRRDTFTVYLRNVTSPFSKVDSAKSIVDSISFSGIFTFPNTPAGNYYIVVKHFNSIETWSKSGGENILEDSAVYNYDFTSSSSQAYGNNLQLKGGKYCLFSGDVNQDGFVTLSDMISVYNNSANFVMGNYLPSDLNGDLIVDLNDLTLCYNNLSNFVGIIRPGFVNNDIANSK